jgi:aryl-alcohol dehydrogenase-like predicted oxidoreductase
MQYTSLGRTGLQVSQIYLGTMNFGLQTSERVYSETLIRNR